MLDFIKDMVKALLPTPDPNEPPHIFRWRQSVSGIVIFMGVIMATFIALSFGLFTFLFSGFASAAAVGDLTKQNTEFRITQLETQIDTARERQCRAMVEGNAEAAKFARDRMQEKINSYFLLQRREYRVPDCNELLPVPMPIISPDTPRPTVPLTR